MNKTLNLQQKISLGLALLLASSLFWSTWLIGLSVFLLFFAALWDWNQWKRADTFLAKIKTIVRFPQYYLLIFIWLAYLLSGLIHQDWISMLSILQLKLPYLLLPLVFFLIRPLPVYWIKWFTIGFIVISTLFALGVLINFLTNLEYYQFQLSQGKSIPTPGSHIRFSLLISLSILWGLYLLLQHEIVLSRKQSILIGSLIAFQFLFLHMLAVKSGLLTTYLGIGVAFIWLAVSTRSFRWITALVGVVILVPLLAYLLFPSLQQKVHYVLHDWSHINDEKTSLYSDTERWRSIEHGWQIFLDQPAIGTGVKDFSTTIQQFYASQGLPETAFKKPHNQFVYALSQLGIIGSIFVFAGLILPFFLCQGWKNLWLMLTATVFLTSCMVEATIETSAGMNLHLLFLLILLSAAAKNDNPVETTVLKQ